MKRVLNFCDHIGIWISGITLIAMMALTTLDVIGRYVFKHPISGTADLTELMMVVIVFSALADTASSGGHIRVEVVTSHLAPGIRLMLKTVLTFLSGLVAAVLAWQLGANAVYTLSHPENTAILDIPKGPFLFVSAVGCGLLTLSLVNAAFDSLADIRRPRKMKKYSG